MHRRTFLTASALVGSTALLASCGIPNIPIGQKAPGVISGDANRDLVKDGKYIIDTSLKDGSHPFLEAVRFTFDPFTDEGRILLEGLYKREGELRLITEELTRANPGFIYNYPWKLIVVSGGVVLEKRGGQQLVPAIRVKEGETYRVRLGYQKGSDPYSVSYQDMQTYFLELREGKNLAGRLEDKTILDPEDSERVRPRDTEAASPNYWRKESLG